MRFTRKPIKSKFCRAIAFKFQSEIIISTQISQANSQLTEVLRRNLSKKQKFHFHSSRRYHKNHQEIKNYEKNKYFKCTRRYSYRLSLYHLSPVSCAERTHAPLSSDSLIGQCDRLRFHGCFGACSTAHRCEYHSLNFGKRLLFSRD